MVTGLLTLTLAAGAWGALPAVVTGAAWDGAQDPRPGGAPPAQVPPPAQVAPQAEAAPEDGASLQNGPVAARAIGLIEGTGAPLSGPDAVVTEAQLHDMLLWREGRSPGGERALRQLLEVRVVEHLGDQAGITVTPEELSSRTRELDDQARAAGLENGLEEMMQAEGIAPAEFERYLRLAMVHERLTRAALGLGPDVEVTGDQQQLWLSGVLKEREYTATVPPFREGYVARSGDLEISTAEFAQELLNMLPPAEVREACYMILLERAVLARMPELGAAGVEAALNREIARRRKDAESDPRFQGASYESMLDARGLTLEAVRRDPAVRAAALAHEAVDRATGEDGLRAAYEENRLRYDAAYGEAVQVYLLWKFAGDDPNNPLVPPADVVSEDLAKIRDAVENREEFLRALEIHSEDKRSRENGGLLGLLSRAGRSNELDNLRRACFDTIDTRPEDFKDVVIGPVRLENGVGIAMLGERRVAPSWDEMALNVHMELRREFLEASLASTQVEIVLGTPAGAAKPTSASAPR